jgi:hypothetical protein
MPLELRELIITAEVGDEEAGRPQDPESRESAALRRDRLVREVAELVLDRLARQQED